MSTSIWDTEVQAVLDGAKSQTSRSITFDDLLKNVEKEVNDSIKEGIDRIG